MDTHAFLIACDLNGHILDIIQDDLELSARLTPGEAFVFSYLAPQNAHAWLEELRDKGCIEVRQWAINTGNETTSLFFSARIDKLRILIAAATTRVTVEQIWSDFGFQPGDPVESQPYIDELGRLNNELVNLQRQLSKRNIELSGINRKLLGAIDELKQKDHDLQIAAVVYRTISEAIMVADANDLIISVNPAFTQLTGYTEQEALGQTTKLLSSVRNDGAFLSAFWDILSKTGNWQGEIWNCRKDGEKFLAWLVINTCYDDARNVLQRIALFSDISEKKEAEDIIWRQANYDSLTGLPNRHMVHECLQLAVKQANIIGLPIALMFIDLDRFKEINDTLGHSAGDVLLVEVAKRLSNCVRKSDTVARLGGDEFTIILRDIDDRAIINRIAQGILKSLTASFLLNDEIAYVSASIGITIYPGDTTEIEQLLKNADQAMYAAKEAGRNRYRFFTPSMQEEAENRMRLTNDLRCAITDHQFLLYYQPIVELESGDIHKAEALIRWQHPQLGMVNPAEFIAIAEETGLIVEIGDWVFKESARQVKHWRTRFDAAFQISVNNSPVQFQGSSDSLQTWFKHLRDMDLPGESLVIEITEGLLMDITSNVASMLLSFRDAGIQVSLDDFGTGYSSLSYLKKFDIDYLKIDQSFVRNLATDSSDMALCEAIIVMAHKLGVKVIAEGIETKEQRQLLNAFGCDYGQGYLFAVPLPADEFAKMLGDTVKYTQQQSSI